MALRPPAPPAGRGSPSLPGGCWPARPASSPVTATFPRRPASPPDLAAGSRRPARLALRTAAPGRTCPESPPRDVTHAAAPITAAPAGPLAGTGPPPPAAPWLARESLATPARSLNTARDYRQVHCTRTRCAAAPAPRGSLTGSSSHGSRRSRPPWSRPAPTNGRPGPTPASPWPWSAAFCWTSSPPATAPGSPRRTSGSSSTCRPPGRHPRPAADAGGAWCGTLAL